MVAKSTMATFDKVKFTLVNMVGRKVEVQTTCGNVYEGIFQAASVNKNKASGVVLGHAYKKTGISPASPFGTAPVDANRDTVIKQLVIKDQDVGQISVVGVDLSYKSAPPDGVDGFTDTGISGGYGQVRERKLEAWAPSPDDASFDVGDLGASRHAQSQGMMWTPEEMFQKNAKEHNYKSDYNELDYTTAINRDDPQYQERMRKAELLARDIVNSDKDHAKVNPHVLAERGFDINVGEEQQFSAVDSTRYVAPAFRNRKAEQSPAKDRDQISSSNAPPGLSSGEKAQSTKNPWTRRAEEQAKRTVGPAQGASTSPPGIKKSKSKAPKQQASRSEQMKELKNFNDNFKLATPKESSSTSPTEKSGESSTEKFVDPPKGDTTKSAPNVDNSETKPKKSTLNPAAKSFSFNPNAKEFSFSPSVEKPAVPVQPQVPGIGSQMMQMPVHVQGDGMQYRMMTLPPQQIGVPIQGVPMAQFPPQIMVPHSYAPRMMMINPTQAGMVPSAQQGQQLVRGPVPPHMIMQQQHQMQQAQQQVTAAAAGTPPQQ